MTAYDYLLALVTALVVMAAALDMWLVRQLPPRHVGLHRPTDRATRAMFQDRGTRWRVDAQAVVNITRVLLADPALSEPADPWPNAAYV